MSGGAKALSRAIKKRNAEFDRRMREDPDRYCDEMNEKANALREKNGLPRIQFPTVEDDRAWAATMRERLGILPPIEDKKSIAAGEVAGLREKLAFFAEKLQARIVEPQRDPKDDAYWKSDWAVYPTVEVIDAIIAISGRLGAYTLDTPKRLKLDESRVASQHASNPRKKPWEDPALDLAKQILVEHPNLTQDALVATMIERWDSEPWRAEIKLVKETQLTRWIRKNEKAGELRRKTVGS
jgi:hypothetical protein